MLKDLIYFMLVAILVAGIATAAWNDRSPPTGCVFRGAPDLYASCVNNATGAR